MDLNIFFFLEINKMDPTTFKKPVFNGVSYPVSNTSNGLTQLTNQPQQIGISCLSATNESKTNSVTIQLPSATSVSKPIGLKLASNIINPVATKPICTSNLIESAKSSYQLTNSTSIQKLETPKVIHFKQSSTITPAKTQQSSLSNVSNTKNYGKLFQMFILFKLNFYCFFDFPTRP